MLRVGTAMVPIGYTTSGRAIWPISGADDGAGTSTDATTTTTDQGDPGTGEGEGEGKGEAAAQGLGEGGKRALEAERTARKAADDRAKAAEAELAKLRDADLSDKERAINRNAELERKNTELEHNLQIARSEAAFVAAATAAGATRPQAVWRLIDLASIEYDDDGRPKNVEKLVEQVKTETPELFKPAHPGSGDGGVRPGAGPEGDMNSLIRAAAGR